MIRMLTAGESHGKALSVIVEGFPSNIPVTKEYIDNQLRRRQMGYGRGGRMKIETDKIDINKISKVNNFKELYKLIDSEILS